MRWAGGGPDFQPKDDQTPVSWVCREAGARAARNVRVADMNIDVPVADDTRVGVVATVCPFGTARISRLAQRSFQHSYVRRAGEPHPRADVEPGSSVAATARRKRHDTYPERAAGEGAGAAAAECGAARLEWGRPRGGRDGNGTGRAGDSSSARRQDFFFFLTDLFTGNPESRPSVPTWSYGVRRRSCRGYYSEAPGGCP